MPYMIKQPGNSPPPPPSKTAQHVFDSPPAPVPPPQELLWLDMKGQAQARLDGCVVPVDRSVLANQADAASPALATAEHVSAIPTRAAASKL